MGREGGHTSGRFLRSGGFPTAEKQCVQRFDRAIESIWRLESASPWFAATGHGAMTCGLKVMAGTPAATTECRRKPPAQKKSSGPGGAGAEDGDSVITKREPTFLRPFSFGRSSPFQHQP